MKQFEQMRKFMKSMNARGKDGKRKRLPGLGGAPFGGMPGMGKFPKK